MRKEFWIILIIALAVLAGIFWFTKNNNNKATSESATADSSNQAKQSPLRNAINESKDGPGEMPLKTMKTYTKVPEKLPISQIESAKATIKTSKGDIVIKFFPDAPQAASNFIVLAKDGFYDGLTFHRREEGFVIQGGDPNGTGTGGPGYKFADEPVTRDYKKGIVAMANSGPNTNGSQFFIMLADTPLPKLYTIFGEVESGLEVVDKISVGDVMDKISVE